jgi:glutamyl-tRNA synthetase
MIRTRFAPSPTGYMHVGSVRTALFAFIIAKQSKGQFILRIEDTDQNRLIDDSINHIIKTLRQLGINYDEGPDISGPYGPYQQSQRLDIYHQWAKKLIAINRAYPDLMTKEELDKLRQQSSQQKKPFLFREHRPKIINNWQPGQPLRFLSKPQRYTWKDEVMGQLTAGEEAIDDFILIKSDGYPTYNFAHIVDDYLMKCTHVIRSSEFIASVPKFLNLYDALNIERPILVTLPPIMNNDGKKKLSKRDGAKDILEYLEQGYLKEALINFLSTLGWNDGTTQELFTLDEIIQKFDIKRVQKSGAKFDENRLTWMNGQYIKKLNDLELINYLKPFWPASAKKYSSDYLMKVAKIIQDRIKYGQELVTLTDYFFEDKPVNLDLIFTNSQLKNLGKEKLINLLDQSLLTFKKIKFEEKILNDNLNNLLIKLNQKPAVLFSLIRIATTQVPYSPGLSETLAILGKEVAIKRIKQTIKALE